MVQGSILMVEYSHGSLPSSAEIARSEVLRAGLLRTRLDARILASYSSTLPVAKVIWRRE